MLARALGVNSSRRVRLVKGSHLVTRKFWDGNQAYLLQNTDKRVIFVNPYEGDLALIGTTDIPVEGRPEDAAIDERRDELPARRARPLFHAQPPGAGRHRPQLQRRPPALRRQRGEPLGGHPRLRLRRRAARQPDGRAPLLSVFGGKITTYRKLAEHALDKLAPFFPQLGPAWTAQRLRCRAATCRTPISTRWLRQLPGRPSLAAGRRWPGTMAGSTARVPMALLAGAARVADLGRHFGARLYEREARFLIDEEWAETAEDILMRRTKHGLHLSAAKVAEFSQWLAA